MFSHKAQSTVHYVALIVAVTGALLWMQNYLKRSIQGRIRFSSDQMADQYQVNGTDLHEHFTQNVSTVEWMLPGPVNITRSRGSYETDNTRTLRPLPQP